jgi:nitroreductase
MDILKTIQERRSIRKYKTDPVPEEIIFEILEAARQAPSWANTQTWRFIIVKDDNTKRFLSDTLSSNNPARNALVEAPLTICLAAKKGASGFYKGQCATDKGNYWFMFDAGIAMEHIVLAAWNFGLGTCHVGLFDAGQAEDILKIPDDYAIVEMTPLGYFEIEPAETPRKPLQDIVYLNQFGEQYKK